MKTTEEFRKELYSKYGERLIIPDDAIYLGSKKPIKVICPVHGEKWMRPNNLLSGSGCKECGYQTVSHKNSDTIRDFLSKAVAKHGIGRYDYSLVSDDFHKYDKIRIRCNVCGRIFLQSPKRHIVGDGCPHCRPFPKKDTNESIREKISLKHPNIELLGEYTGDNDSIITVRCKIHGNTWKTTPHRLFQQKYGCSKCYQEERVKSLKNASKDKFMSFLKDNLSEIYDTSKVLFNGMHSPITLTCKRHGDFTITPTKIMYRGDGCPLCKESHLERRISQILSKNGIVAERLKRFDWLGLKSLDFYLPKYNAVIECQGEQHLIPRDDSLFNKQDKFHEKVHRDILKNRLCRENGLNMIYIINDCHKALINNPIFEGIYTNENTVTIEKIEKNNYVLIDKLYLS